MINVTFVGNLTKDAEMKNFGNERGVVNMTVASNRHVKGESVATFVEVKFFGKVERLTKILPYLTKGNKVAGAGDLVQENWTVTAPNGEAQNRSKLVINVTNIELVGGNSGNNAVQPAQQPAQQPATAPAAATTQTAQPAAAQPAQQPAQQPAAAAVDDDEDIPF